MYIINLSVVGRGMFFFLNMTQSIVLFTSLYYLTQDLSNYQFAIGHFKLMGLLLFYRLLQFRHQIYFRLKEIASTFKEPKLKLNNPANIYNAILFFV